MATKLAWLAEELLEDAGGLVSYARGLTRPSWGRIFGTSALSAQDVYQTTFGPPMRIHES